MQGGFGPRFALEAGFLIAVAIAAGFAQLSATAIVVVMAAAWLLVCLFELSVWVEGPRFPSFRREVVEVEEQTDPETVLAEPGPPVESGPEPVAVRPDREDG